MFKQTISKELGSVIREVAEDCDIQIHDDYSGRYMYGATCLGLSLEGSASSLFAAFIRGLKNADNHTMEEAAEMFDDMKTDNLGLGTILYFPGWKFDESESEGKDKEPEEDEEYLYFSIDSH